jgi:hypothetical protein
MECYEKIIKKDMIDPLNGAKMTEKDVIPLERVSFLIMTHDTCKLYSCDSIAILEIIQ